MRLAPAATWIGHSTVLLSLRGANVLTDPMFAEHLFTLRRRAPPGVALADLPPLAAVLVSHDHADHLDAEAVRAIGDRPRWIVPLGLAPWLRAHGIENVIELDWWQSTELARPGLPPLRVTLVPAQHWGRRGLLDENRRLWGGFVVEGAGDPTIYFAGDTGAGAPFAAIRDRFPRIDLALLPVGAYEPRWYMAPKHVSPEEAAAAFRLVGARFAIPIHWGTFRLGAEPMDEPPRRFLAALGADASRAFVLPIGGTLRLPAPRESRTQDTR